MASWMDPRELDAQRARAETGQSIDPAFVIALLDERDRLRAALIRQEYDVVEALAEAQGMTKDPEYGYPVGDHTAETMAREMITYCAMLRRVAREALT